jgi:hypothetical protein
MQAKIEFTGPAAMADDGGVNFAARVNGQPVRCHFSEETLQDMDPDDLHGDPLSQFEAHRFHLLAAAELKIQKGLVNDGLVSVYTSDI